MLADKPHGRRLTAAEQMRLEQLERQLRDDDPQLAEAFSMVTEPRTFVSRGSLLAGAATLTIVLVLFAALIGGAGGAMAVAATLLAAFAGWRYLQHRRRN
jgi:hypothetical protein